MRPKKLGMHMLPLFVWAVLITAFFTIIIITCFSWCYYNVINRPKF
jgi:heme/copper-type cytochrome/quinol oxidase subunit 1